MIGNLNTIQQESNSQDLDLLKLAEKKLCDQRYSEVKCAFSLLIAGVDSKLVSLRTDLGRKCTAS